MIYFFAILFVLGLIGSLVIQAAMNRHLARKSRPYDWERDDES